MTIGVFDGVHRGHQQIIAALVRRARDAELPAVVITFDPHPSEVVRPGTHPARLTSLDRKAELLAGLGVNVMCVLPFTVEFSHLQPAEFVHRVLVEHLHASAVVVGENFRFGHRAAGDVATLSTLGKTFGFVTEAVPIVSDHGIDNIRFSSTYVRSCIDAGDLAEAARVLGRPHRLSGIVVRGAGRGRRLGFPTANMHTEPYAAMPADGVYAGYVVVGQRRHMGAVSIGTNPTFDGHERSLECYLLDFDGDLYGHTIAVEFAARLRDIERFDTVPALVEQMGKDVAQARALLRPDG